MLQLLPPTPKFSWALPNISTPPALKATRGEDPLTSHRFENAHDHLITCLYMHASISSMSFIVLPELWTI